MTRVPADLYEDLTKENAVTFTDDEEFQKLLRCVAETTEVVGWRVCIDREDQTFDIEDVVHHVGTADGMPFKIDMMRIVNHCARLAARNKTPVDNFEKMEGLMDERFFLITREFLEEMPDGVFCTVSLEDGEYAGRTAEEVGQFCKNDLLATLEQAEKIGLTLLCAEEFDGIRIVRGSTMSEHIFMNPGQIEAVKNTLELWAKVGGSLDKLVETLKRTTEVDAVPAESKMTAREAFEAEFEDYTERARKIGNWIYRNNSSEFRYIRKRRPISDSYGKMCFVAKDAYEPVWNHCRGEWMFDASKPYEVEMFVKFLEHDEKLYAKYFQKEK